MFDNIVPGLISGVVSGLLASLLFYIFMQLIKPRLRVSPKIALEVSADGTYIYRIKVVNASKTELTNIRYRLYYCKITSNGSMVDIKELPPAKVPIFMISRYDKKSEVCEYAYRLSYKVDSKEYPLDKDHYMMFSISAEHSVSNTLKSVTKTYQANDIQKGCFETGLSLKII